MSAPVITDAQMCSVFGSLNCQPVIELQLTSKGIKGDPGDEDATSLDGIPLNLVNMQEGQVIQLVGGELVNVNKQAVVDGTDIVGGFF